jgi:hypothetical protein
MKSRIKAFSARLMLMASVAAAVSATIAAAPAPSVKLGKIKAQLFYEETGRFSQDLMQAKDLSLWNTCIGEGSAEEIANDLLVSVEITSSSEQYVSTPLRIVAKGEKGSVLAERTFSGMLVPATGRVWKAVWLRDVSCSGIVNMSVTFGKQTRNGALNFDGGE